MTTATCVAIDLGASSGRVVLVDCNEDGFVLREARRFGTPCERDAKTGYVCWDLDRIEAEIRAGISAAAAMAPPESVGVDGWGVDYVLLDAAGRRVAPAVSYRDDRTRGIMERVFAQIPAQAIYRRTGIQFQPFNTLYQLAATARHHSDWLARARHLLMLPDYFHFRLAGVIAHEYTNATTTQLYAITANDWDDDLLAAAGIGRELLTRPVAPGTILGDSTALESGRRVKVVAPGTHDTASAVAAIPFRGGDEAFISSGSWSLMGVESERPFADEKARLLNFTNEGGVNGRYRVLKNITGLWIIQQMAKELGIRNATVLTRAAEAAVPWRSLINPTDARFLSPPSMITAICDFCAETGQPEPADEGALARCVFESLALSYRQVKIEIESLLGRSIARIHLGGGGGQNRLLDQLTADTCQVPVIVGPAEISVLGNACAQFIGLGVFASLAEARALIRRSFAVQDVEPRHVVPDNVWNRFYEYARRPGPNTPERRSSLGTPPASPETPPS